MKKLFSAILVLISFQSFAQENLTTVKVKSINNKEISFADLTSAKDSLIVVSFWATWCIPCIAELENINDELTDWQKKIPMKFIGIAVDDSRTSQRVKAFVKGKGWQFDVFLDVNNDLKRALSVTDIPHVMVIKNNKIVYRHTGYIAGEENNLYKELQALNK